MFDKVLVAVETGARLIPGSTAHTVIHLADRPVLIVR